MSDSNTTSTSAHSTDDAQPPKMRDGIDMSPEAIKKRISGITPKEERQEVSQLPRWVRIAIIRRELYGITAEQACKEAGRTTKTLYNYCLSPAVEKLRAQLRELAADPIRVAQLFLRGSAAELTMETFAMLDIATASGDYAEAGKMLRDLMDRIPRLQKSSVGNSDGAAPQIVINVGGSGNELAPIVDADYTIMEVESEVRMLPDITSDDPEDD